MSASPSQPFNLNGVTYDASQLPPAGQHLFQLIQEAQAELTRLETRKALLQAAQQQLISQLKPLLPATAPGDTGMVILGQASETIPTTPSLKPDHQPSPLPDSLPAAIRANQS